MSEVFPNVYLCIHEGCAKKALPGQQWCRSHGGPYLNMGGKQNIYRKYVPKNLGAIIDSAIAEEDLSLTDELELLKSLLIEKLQALSSTTSEETFKRVTAKLNMVQARLTSLDIDKKAKAEIITLINEARQPIIAARDNTDLKREIRLMLTEVRDLARTESSIRYNRITSLSQKELIAFQQVLISIIVKNVLDQNVREAIRCDLVRVLNSRSSGRDRLSESNGLESSVIGPVDSDQDAPVVALEAEQRSADIS
jgi:hypothetical protein